MELKYLKTFTTVVRLGSFSKAAEFLYISQPTISLHIRNLEEELKTRLIIRSAKSFEVTPKGLDVYRYAVSILQLTDRMISECSIESRKIVTIGASTIPSAYILPEVLPDFVAGHPEIYFVIDQSDSAGVITKLLDGVLDVGLIGMKPSDERITSIPFYTDHVVIITPVNDHFLRYAAMDTPPVRELFREPIILREEGSGSKKAADRLMESLGIGEASLDICARMNDPEAIKNMVAGGLGISLISDKAAEDYRKSNRVLTFRFPDADCARQLYIVYRKDFVLRSSARLFKQYLLEYYSRSAAPSP